MKQKIINFRDPVVERVVEKFVGRSDVGFEKYGVTLEDDPSDMLAWLNHLQEEMMDAVLYLQKAKQQYEAQRTEK
ncbi:MAG: hypothetical protein ACKVJK_04885 [Methylophagaceae bacterium]|jgi:hypothetical protein|tara:strand:+ start:174 stop:398 length:225 start_codon:yes stop_codon:yes gene_type:complete